MTGKKIDVTILCPGPVFSRFLENAFTGTPGQVSDLFTTYTSKQKYINKLN